MSRKIAYVSTVDMTLHFFFTEQMLYLDKLGYNVWAVASEGKYAKELKEKGINFYPVEMKRGLSPFFDLKALFKLYLFFKKERFDVVHTHTPKANLLGRIAAKAAGIKKILATIHGFYFYNMSGIKRWLYVFLNRLGGLCSDKVLIINDYDLKIAGTEGIIRKDKIVYLKGGVGVDVNKYTIPTLEERKQARGKYGLSLEEKILGFIGRVEKEKGIDDILSAAKLLKGSTDGIKYMIIGDGPYLHEYKEKVSKAELKDSFVFTGFIDSTKELFSLFDIFVFPSRREGLPVVVMEAMAAGVPVVASKVRGCVDIIENNADGFLVEQGDIDGLVSAVNKLIKSPELLKRFSDSGRMKVERYFDRNKIIQDVELLYRN